MRFLPGALVVLLPTLGSGCAHAPAEKGEAAELRRTVDDLRLQNKRYSRQVEELENQVFILSDQLESRKVNEEKQATPQLPTVTLHPAPTRQVAQEQAPEPTEAYSEEPEVEYAGEAARSSERRPVLRLHGDSMPVYTTREPAKPEPRATETIRETSAPKAQAGGEAVVAYRKAYDLLRDGKHDDAVKAFRDFLRQHPSHDLSDNAQYWLGECFYDRKEFTAAVREFRRVIERYPTGNKVPDALLKVGFSYLSLGSVEAGRQTLEQLQRSYPRHEAASLAAAKLSELDQIPAKGGSSEVSKAAHTAHVSKEVP